MLSSTLPPKLTLIWPSTPPTNSLKPTLWAPRISSMPPRDNEYAASKAGAEMFALAYAHTYQLPVTISNATNNLGPYQYPEKFVPLAITNVLEGKKVPLYGRGEHIRDWIFVEDHCRAIDLILKNGNPGERYLVGSNHP